jgi:DNA-damage-inducible protein D
MIDLELIFTMLADKATKEIAQIREAQGFEQNKVAARVDGDVAANARRNLEAETRRPTKGARWTLGSGCFLAGAIFAPR